MKTKSVKLAALVLAVCLFVSANGTVFAANTAAATKAANKDAVKAAIAELQAKIKDLKDTLAKTVKGNASSTAAVTDDGLQCVRTALAVRESQVVSAHRAEFDSINAAFASRTPALLAAWTINNNFQRNTAIAKVNDDFDAAKKSAQENYKQTKDAAWQTYKDALKVCKADDNFREASDN